MAHGKVKWFNDSKGYGFIVPDDGGKDIFVHHTGIDAKGHRCLNKGQHVEFEICNGQKGPQAEHVRVIAQPAVKSKPAENNVVETTAADRAANAAQAADAALSQSKQASGKPNTRL